MPPPDPEDDDTPPVDDEEPGEKENREHGVNSSHTSTEKLMLFIAPFVLVLYLAIRRTLPLNTRPLHIPSLARHVSQGLRALYARLFRRNAGYASLPSYEPLDSEMVMLASRPTHLQMATSHYHADRRQFKSPKLASGSGGTDHDDPLSIGSESIPLKPSPQLRVHRGSVFAGGYGSIGNRDASR